MKGLCATLAVLALIGALSARTTGAAGTARADAPVSQTCKSGVISAGTYSELTVTGVCRILGAHTGPVVEPGGPEQITNCNDTGGAVNVLGKLTIAPNGFLDAGSCAPTVTVGGDVSVESGGTLLLGCDANLAIMPPAPPFPSVCPGITTSERIGGNVTTDHALAVIIHATTINGNLSIHGGGGGLDCTTVDPNLSAALDSALGSTLQQQKGTPAYTDAEDNTIGGNLHISGMQGCWMGAFRNTIAGNVQVVGNTNASLDANEVVQNTISGNINCVGNNPAIHYGDSGDTPNLVQGNAHGECGFDVLSPNPFLLPPVPPSQPPCTTSACPISVRVGGGGDADHS